MMLEKELRFIAIHAGQLGSAGGRFPEAHGGVVNYSSKRGAVCVWRDLYMRRIVPLVKSANYADTVELYLDRRRRRSNPGAHVVGVLAVVDGAQDTLSAVVWRT
jgi:hypothetical protein